ncbi:rhodanese-like domain-containing protein [Confluentibacter sediminis]|uniref:rhodanese-like domain-containing protein n=1 Tax=Confluentibacter sediminis TaxID=2219045 RepID=UPI000DABB55D|nr:rhodanese-like domain-containing protein [Confluentibacter sediminis]
MKKLSFLYVILIITFSSCKEVESPKITIVSPEEMQSFLQADNVQLIDVRTAKEFENGHIPGAQNIDFFSPTFVQDITKLDKDKPVYLYCNSGKRSAKCAQKMLEEGFVKIYDLDGGFSKWKYEGLEIKN